MKRYLSFACSLFALIVGTLFFMPRPTQAGPASPDSVEIKPSLFTPALTYTVKTGDWLSGIARDHYDDMHQWPTIYGANSQVIGIDPHLIEPGQVIVIPDLVNTNSVTCAGQQMDKSQLAAHRDIPLEELNTLQTVRGLTLKEICNFSDEKLAKAITRAHRPSVEHTPTNPDAALKQRLLQLQDEHGNIPDDAYQKAAAQIEILRSNSLGAAGAGLNGAGSWTWLGPGNIGGRSRSLVIHPTNTNTMWLGSVSGGIWKTTNGGTSWQVQDDFMANMAVSTLVMDPNDADTIYAGTGEGQGLGGDRRGAGVFKTTNGGTTWTQLGSTTGAEWQQVNRLAIHPANSQILLAATDAGLYKTSNAGTSWTQVVNGGVSDVNFNPGNGALAIASDAAGWAAYSTNTGDNWTNATFNAPGTAGGRIEIAYAPSNPNIVYASMNQNQGEIWRSADGGQTYSRFNTGNNFLGTQGGYDNIVWVNPNDAAFVIVGGIDLWRSTDSGATLTKISRWQEPSTVSAHADHHYILEHPNFDNNTNKTVFFTNDGGIYRVDDVSTVAETTGWQELNNNLGITQFYGAAGNAAANRITGGTQDNGDLRYTGNAETWNEWGGGDGGFAAIDPADANYVYGEYVFLEIRRSTNGGEPGSEASIDKPTTGNPITESRDQNNALFIAPFIMDPNNSSSLLGGALSLWKSTNVKAADLNDINWAVIKTPTGNEKISAIAVAPGDSNTIWVGHANETADAGHVFKTTNGGTNWTRVDNQTPNLPDRYVTRITIDPKNSNIVYVTFGGFSADNVWRTTDGGTTWTDATGAGGTGLPDIPVRSLVVHPITSTWIYAGTEMGVYASENSGANWTATPQHDGPTNAPVDELSWMGNDLLAATHGRGIFKASPSGSTANTKAYLPIILK